MMPPGNPALLIRRKTDKNKSDCQSALFQKGGDYFDHFCCTDGFVIISTIPKA